MNFRHDINGLRAVAVIAVVIFHINPALLPGGFAGVDVFFVISGYLMTSIIWGKHDRGTFSLSAFYWARATRIIPALTVFTGVLLAANWFYLPPYDYTILGEHASSSLLFLSNFTYWSEAGYFDADSHEKWLLHTWSLSVEWQFYLIYPLIVLLLKTILPSSRAKLGLAFLTGSGLVVSATTSKIWPEASYFLLHTRFWEMLIGGLVYLFPVKLAADKSRLLSLTGLAMIIASFFLIDKQTPWPGIWAVLPVFGAFLVIIAKQEGAGLMGNVALQKIGFWSYSIYLWHWAVVVLVFTLGQSSNYFWQAGIGVLSLALGAASYYWVEKRLSAKFWIPLWVFFIFAGLYVLEEKPETYRASIPDSVIATIDRRSYECFDRDYQHQKEEVACSLSEGNARVLVLGDSHMYAVLPALENLAEAHQVGMDYVGYSGCPPLLSVYPDRKDQVKKNCNALNAATAILPTKKDYAAVLLASRWTYFTEGNYEGKKNSFLFLQDTDERSKANSKAALRKGIEDTFAHYANLGVAVLVLLQVPLQEFNADEIYLRSLDLSGSVDKMLLIQNSVSKAKHEAFQKEVNDLLSKEAAKYANITIVDPASVLCDTQTCLAGSTEASFYFDKDHLSIVGAELLAPLLLEHFFEQGILVGTRSD